MLLVTPQRMRFQRQFYTIFLSASLHFLTAIIFSVLSLVGDPVYMHFASVLQVFPQPPLKGGYHESTIGEKGRGMDTL